MHDTTQFYLEHKEVNVVAHRLDPRQVFGNNECLLFGSLQIRRIDCQRRLLKRSVFLVPTFRLSRILYDRFKFRRNCSIESSIFWTSDEKPMNSL